MSMHDIAELRMMPIDADSTKWRSSDSWEDW